MEKENLLSGGCNGGCNCTCGTEQDDERWAQIYEEEAKSYNSTIELPVEK